MKPYRKTGIAVGLLFLAATLAFLAAHELVLGVLEVPDGLARAASQPNPLTTGVLLLFVDALAVVGIAFLLFPLLKSYSEPLALGYVGLRVGEFAAVLLLMAGPLLVVPLAVAAPGGGLEGSASGDLAVVARAQYGSAMALVFLCTGASGTILGYVLTRSKLVPRAVALLGAVGYPALLLGTVLEMFELLDLQQGVGLALVCPVGLFELVFPVWLFVKGFDAEAVADA